MFGCNCGALALRISLVPGMSVGGGSGVKMLAAGAGRGAVLAFRLGFSAVCNVRRGPERVEDSGWGGGDLKRSCTTVGFSTGLMEAIAGGGCCSSVVSTSSSGGVGKAFLGGSSGDIIIGDSGGERGAPFVGSSMMISSCCDSGSGLSGRTAGCGKWSGSADGLGSGVGSTTCSA